MAAETKAFSLALRNFLRGPEDDGKLRTELYELAESGIISQQQVDILLGDYSTTFRLTRYGCPFRHQSMSCICI